ncbi:PEP-CTERM sorting domain-containing protein [Massilia sp. METH4]|uniref:PEP-CTERM sorting domain-containing protein n=1 Tax=Massilia sp. METH4 TaxID=3123041 RepID=UPI0030CBB104
MRNATYPTLLAGLMLAGMAAAAPSGVTNVNISNVQMFTFDLNTMDGVAPGYTIDPGQAYAYTRFTSERGFRQNLIGTAHENLTEAGTVGLERGDAAVHASWLGLPAEIAVSVHSDSPATYLEGEVTYSVKLILSANTGFAFTGLASQFASAPAAAAPWPSNYSSYINMSLYDPLDPFNEIRYNKQFSGEDVTSAAYDIADPFNLTYLNDSDSARELSLRFKVYGAARAPAAGAVSAVPEPGAYLMLGAGLSLLALHARRRKTTMDRA